MLLSGSPDSRTGVGAYDRLMGVPALDLCVMAAADIWVCLSKLPMYSIVLSAMTLSRFGKYPAGGMVADKSPFPGCTIVSRALDRTWSSFDRFSAAIPSSGDCGIISSGSDFSLIFADSSLSFFSIRGDSRSVPSFLWKNGCCHSCSNQ